MNHNKQFFSVGNVHSYVDHFLEIPFESYKFKTIMKYVYLIDPHEVSIIKVLITGSNQYPDCSQNAVECNSQDRNRQKIQERTE